MIQTRAERRQLERAKEKHVAKLVAGGWNDFKDVTNEPRTQQIMQQVSEPPVAVYTNNLFVVQVFNHQCEWGLVKKAMIRRADAAAEHDWAMLQKIKNEIFGKDATALEVYPKEHRKVDVANLYWLWVLPPGFDCPIEVGRR